MNETAKTRKSRPARSLHGLMKAALLLIALCGAAVCVFWFPYAAASGMQHGADMPVPEFWTRCAILLAFDYAAALPCFAVLFFLWRISDRIAEGALFREGAVRDMRIAAFLLFGDLAFFLVGNLVFCALGMNGWLPVYLFLIACGLAVALLFFLISKCLREAANLQEESDGTI